MSSALLRKAVDKTEAMDSALKKSLLDRVNDCVKELQLKCTSERSNSLVNDEATNSFLWVLEAVFIHGLSNSFLKATSPFASLLNSFSPTSSFASNPGRSDSSPAVPNPSFWEFVLVFLHRDIIDQINSLHLIHTDVGRCRAWLRIALNEGLLQSFLDNMTLKSNRRCLKAFYRSSSFLRDTEKCDILKNYLMGIELLDFRLVINNSFLNHWNSGPLSLVGLWVDENESVQQGVDVAKNIESKEFQAIPKLQQRHNNSIAGGGTPPRFYSELDSVLRRQPPPLLSEDDALRIILSSSPRPSPSPQASTPKAQSSSSSQFPLPPPKASTLSSPRKKPPMKTKKSESSTQLSPQLSSPDLHAVATPSAVSNPTDKSKMAEEPPSINVESPSSPNKTNQSVINTPPLSSISELSSNDGGKNKSSSQPVVDNEVVEEPQVIALSRGNLLQINSPPDPDKMCSSPTEVPPAHMDLSVSSIEMESPTNERSYTDVLLKYQERSKLQNPTQLSEDDYSINNNSATTTTSDLVLSSHEDSDNGQQGSNSRKESTSGCSNTTSVSVRSQSSNVRVNKTRHSADEGVELITAPRTVKELIMELMPRISKYTKVLANETGLDSQNYACKTCSTSIGMIYGAAYLCNFTGALYCSTCHVNQEKVIPARILLNWDFGLYPVCKQAYDFLEDLKDEPVFDVQEINSILYREIDECKLVKSLRSQLFYIGMYLKTCKNTKALEELKKEAGAAGKEHLLDSIHLYSLSDLLGIPSRSLINLLTKLVSTGSGHILSCTICREKGFICECCRSPQVIFPFELEKIFKCNECGAVYHNTCMSYEKSCPRCERWKKNETPLVLDENENE